MPSKRFRPPDDPAAAEASMLAHLTPLLPLIRSRSGIPDLVPFTIALAQELVRSGLVTDQDITEARDAGDGTVFWSAHEAHLCAVNLDELHP